MTKLKKLNLVLGQPQAVTLDGLDTLAKVTDSVEAGSDIDATINLESGYADTVEKLQATFPSLRIMVGKNYIRFDDENLRQYVAPLAGDGVGVTQEQAATYVFPTKSFYQKKDTYLHCNVLRYFLNWGVTLNSNNTAWQNTFRDSYIKSVTLPPTVTNIPTNCFYNCGSLTHVGGIEQVQVINASAFRDCVSLTKVEISSPVVVEFGVFYNCTALRDFDLSRVTTLRQSSFYNCKSLIGGDLSNVEVWTRAGGDATFYNCASLTHVKFGKITSIPGATGAPWQGAFLNCTGIRTIDFNNIENISGSAFEGCTSLESITHTEKVETLASLAFNKCTNLTGRLAFPSLVTLGGGAFYQCSNLVAIVSLGGITAIGEERSWNGTYGLYGAFNGCSNLESVNLPTTLTHIYGESFRGCGKLAEINLPSSIIKIGGYAFMDCLDMEVSVNLPALTSLDRAFMGAGITSVENLGVITELLAGSNTTGNNRGTFAGCKKLESVVLPSTLTSIGAYSFNGCSLLRTVTGGVGVQSIGAYAFDGCPAITTLEITGPIVSIGSGAFRNCGTSEFTLDLRHVTSLPATAFTGSKLSGDIVFEDLTSMDCGSRSSTATGTFQNTLVRSVTFPQGHDVTLTGGSFDYPGGAFTGAKELVSADLGALTRLTQGMFHGCSKLSAVVSNNIVTVSENAFRETPQLGEVIMPNLTTDSSGGNGPHGVFYNSGITGFYAPNLANMATRRAGYGGFLCGCPRLQYIYLGAITFIGDGTISSCASLKYVIIDRDTQDDAEPVVATLSGSQYDFRTCPLLEAIYVPDAYLADYQASSVWTRHAAKLKGIIRVSSLPSAGDSDKAYSMGGHVYRYESGQWVRLDQVVSE